MKKLICVLSALFSLFSVSVRADEIEERSISLIADGYGKICITQNDVKKELTIEGNTMMEELSGDDSVTIEAIPNEGYEVSFFSIQNKDVTGELVAKQSSDPVSSTLEFDQSKVVQISFCTKEESETFYSTPPTSKSKLREARVKSIGYEMLLEHEVGDTFTGRLTTDNEDIYADWFHVNYLDGGLSDFSDLFINGNITLHCLNPGYIGPTSSISVYGLYAPIYHTYHATITSLDRQKGEITLSMYTDPITTPYGTSLYGYNNGVQVGYQTLGRTREYGGEITLQAPGENISISKLSVDGNQVSGAILQVLQEDNVIDTFTTTKEPYFISVQSGTYTIKEISAPSGYVLASPVTIHVNDTDTTFAMTDTRVGVLKVDAETNQPLEGVQLQVKDEDNTIVDSFVSTKEKYYVSNLVEGKTYTLEEVEAPVGYALAKPISFTPVQDSDITITMKNVPVTIKKLDAKNRPIENASFEIYDTQHDLVEKFTTTSESYKPKNLVYGETYTIKEVNVPEGYVEMDPVTFTIDKESSYPISLFNYQIQVSKVDTKNGQAVIGSLLQVKDTKGNIIDEWISSNEMHNVNNLKENREYTLYEVKAADGYTIAKPISFKTEQKDKLIVMKDTQVSLLKLDDSKDPVEGAHFIVKDKENKIVDEWDSTKEKHFIKNLEIGKSYTIEEIIAPKGYYFSQNITFTVKEQDQDIVVTDNVTNFEFFKVDDDGNPVKGVSLLLFDETEGKTIEEWTSNEKAHSIKNVLIASHWYRLIETELVNGVYQSVDILFQCPKYHTSEPIKVTMVDELTDITVLKTDENGDPLPNAHLSIVEAILQEDGSYQLNKDEDGNLISEYDFISKNTLEGESIDKYIRTDKKYYLVETEAPSGYSLAEPVLFEITGKRNSAQVVRMMDEKEPTVETGIHTSLVPYIFIFGICSMMFLLLYIVKKEGRN